MPFYYFHLKITAVVKRPFYEFMRVVNWRLWDEIFHSYSKIDKNCCVRNVNKILYWGPVVLVIATGF